MWGESSKECEHVCQLSGLLNQNFKINSGNNATKRRREESVTNNFKLKMNPHSLNFNHPLSPLNKSPVFTPSKRRVLGEIQNSPYTQSPLASINSPKLNSPFVKRSTKISRVFEERTKFKMSNKENTNNIESFAKYEEETVDLPYTEYSSPIGRVLQKSKTVKNWTLHKMASESPERNFSAISKKETDLFALDTDLPDLDSDMDTLHDLDAELDNDNFDHCTKYEIISTDSPDIISRGRSTTKIAAKNFLFGAPLADTEQSTSFNRPSVNATRMLNFDENFTSPMEKKTNVSVKKSLKFPTHTPTKNLLRHENSSSSIGSMTMSPISHCSSQLRLFPSESTTSMESGFISEVEETFLDLEETSSSPKMANFNELLSGTIKNDLTEPSFSMKRPSLQRSLSYNPDASRAKVSLFKLSEGVDKRSQKRCEPLTEETGSCSKRRKSNVDKPLMKRPNRPVLQRAYSENAASIMSALARSASDPDLIGDFSRPFALPLTRGDHDDLKSISCDTLAKLLRGEFEDVSDFQVIDCRYPYEYSGGHIAGAKNMYNQDQVLSLIDKPLEKKPEDGKRSVLVFHCEFSLERGPKLSRFLRSSDRAKNKENYPSLHYPEIYLLHEGYRAFYTNYSELCEPTGYTPMRDPGYRNELVAFRRCNSTGSKSFMM